MPSAVLPAGPACMDALHALLDELWTQAPQTPSAARDRFTLALAEVVGNVVAHGRTSCGEVPSLELDLRSGDGRLEARVVDDGTPVPDAGPAEMPDPMAEGGRGLAIAHEVLDEVAYEHAGGTNRWRLVLLL